MADVLHPRLSVQPLGVGSEVGLLRTVIMHRPDLAHERASQARSGDVPSDDPVWVRRAQQEFDALVELLRRHGVEVLLLHDLLTETLHDSAAREWLLARRLRPEDVTAMFSAGLRAWMREMPAAELAGRLTQGVMASEVPGHVCPVMSRATRPTDFVIAPLPNHLFTRDASAWIGAGVALAVMRCPIRRREALNVEAIYRWHPRFRGARLKVWIGGGDHDWGDATIDGGDVIAAGEGVVVLGEGGRTTAAAASMLAGKLIAAGAARIVIGARLPGPHARRHLDTALAFCDRHVVAVREPVVSAIAAVRYEADGDGGVTATLSERPLLDELRDELGVTDLTVVAGDEHDTLGVVALAPGVVVADERNESTNQRLADAGVEVHVTPAQELGRARGAAHGMTCPVWRDP